MGARIPNTKEALEKASYTDNRYKGFYSGSKTSSSGLSTGMRVDKLDRAVKMLSLLERDLLSYLAFFPQVANIRENYPLPLEETIPIAKALGYRHPKMPGTRIPVNLTTDFFVDFADGRKIAYTVKHLEKLKESRVREKFQMEYQYYAAKGIPWKIVTENSVNRTVAENLRFLRKTADPDSCLAELASEFSKLIENSELNIAAFCQDFEKRFSLETGDGWHMFYYLLKEGVLKIDFRKLIKSYRFKVYKYMEHPSWSAYWRHLW